MADGNIEEARDPLEEFRKACEGMTPSGNLLNKNGTPNKRFRLNVKDLPGVTSSMKTPCFEVHLDVPPNLQLANTDVLANTDGRAGTMRRLGELVPGHKCRVVRRAKRKSGIKRRTIHVPVGTFDGVDDEKVDSFLAAHFDEWVESYGDAPMKNEAAQRQNDFADWRSLPLPPKEAPLSKREAVQKIIHRGGYRIWLDMPSIEISRDTRRKASAITENYNAVCLWELAREWPLILKVRRIPDGPQCDSIRLEDFIRHQAEYLVVNCNEDRSEVQRICELALSVISSRRVDDRDWELALRIVVPATQRTRWQCALCAVAADDPSAIFSPDDEAANSLNETQLDRLRTMFERETDRVKDVWKPLSRILQPSTSCDIAETELVDLLTRALGELEDAGVRVQLPKELIDGRASRVQKKCKVTDDGTPRKPGFLKKDVLLKFQVEVAVDGEPLTPDELQQLASIREPLLKVRGKWLYLDPQLKGELQRISEDVLSGSVKLIPAQEAVCKILTNEVQDASGANAVPTEFEIGVDRVQELLDSFRAGNPPQIALPKGLDAKLRSYQLHGLNWLTMLGAYGLGACLADDMGLGKTLQTLAWLQHRKESGITDPALLICPTSVIMNWEKEARRFTPKLRVFRQHGPNRPNDALKFFARARKESTDLVITSFGTMCQDLELFRSVSWKWSAVILDEAQNIKNPSTTQSKAARSLSEYAVSRLALTGTPVENGPRDLWPIMEFLNPGMLGTWSEYVKNVASPIEHEKDRNHRQELRAKIKPFILRRKKTDPGIADELPPKIEQTVWCSLTREQAGWYQASLNNMKAALQSKDKKERQGAILTVLQELKQACNGVAVLQKDRSQISSRAGKVTQLISMLATVVENREKAIVFSQYPSQFEELSELLMDRLEDKVGWPVGVVTLTGDDPVSSREFTQKNFAEIDRIAVLLISLRAGGTGLNLQSANHVFHLDRWWNGAVEDQATDRAWRIGQKKVVHAHKFVCRGTLEERIDAMISKKRKLASDLLGDADEASALLGDGDEASVASQLAKLDTDALYDVLRLDESEAVGDDDSEAGDGDDI